MRRQPQTLCRDPACLIGARLGIRTQTHPLLFSGEQQHSVFRPLHDQYLNGSCPVSNCRLRLQICKLINIVHHTDERIIVVTLCQQIDLRLALLALLRILIGLICSAGLLIRLRREAHRIISPLHQRRNVFR